MQPLEQTAKKKKRETIPQGVRFNVFRRDNFTCRYCGGTSPDVTLECDHVIAVANGGSDDESNLVTSCWDCNRGKRVKTVNLHAVRHMKRAANQPANDNAVVGLFGHTRDENGKILWQFHVNGMVGTDMCTIQLFSWNDGRPTDVKVIPLKELCGEKCSLYSSRDEWVWRWAKESAEECGKSEVWARGTFRMATGHEFGEAA